jgi:inorganic pyrophosphatase
MSLENLSPGAAPPHVISVVVEIPKGSRNKIEYDHDNDVFRLDRILYSPVHYPGDYGFVPGTLSDDGDPLDALVLVTDPTFTGCLISARPIGVLLMTDEKGQDEKILAVPERDPRFEEMSDLSDLPRHLLKELEHFFGVYKDLEDKATAVLGWESVPRARQIITTAIAAYENKQA